MDNKDDWSMQLSSSKFWFGVITESNTFRKYRNFAIKQDLVRDICSDEITDKKGNIPLDDYLYVIQKSEKWLKLRAEAQATASSIGKFIKGPTMYPTMTDVSDHWMEKIHKVPFKTTHTMRGHMKWGVGYEDPALIHFAVENMLCVTQVGTIHVPLKFIYSLAKEYVTEWEKVLPYVDMSFDESYHLLISPDGVVGVPDPEAADDKILSENLLGMLEIKCISPFHHMEDTDDKLVWVDDMETRQWMHPREIPMGYIIQICLQAISGYWRLDMNGEHTMWFMRFSPKGFSQFEIKFKDLISVGILSTALYFSLHKRILLESDLPLVYTKGESIIANALSKEYKKLVDKMTHKYVSLENLYPEFYVYRKCTERHKFEVTSDN